MEKPLFRVGTAGPVDKFDRIGFPSITKYAKERNVEIVQIDSTKPIEEQGKFDVILQKMTYEMEGDKMKYFKYRDLYEYQHNHKEVVFIDDLDAVEVTCDRCTLTEALSKVKWPEGIDIAQPQAATLLKNDIDSIRETTAKLHFPLLAKPLGGFTNDEAHTMRLATSPESLVGVPVPCLLQEYINHGAVVYKIYALGNHLEVTTRTSTRDIQENEQFTLNFHSQHSKDENGLWDHSINLEEYAKTIPYDKFALLSEALRRDLKLHLVGFDILIDKNGKYWIVDVNYFPGYKFIENIEEKFFNFIVDVYNHKQ